jgi:hypothetical protein
LSSGYQFAQTRHWIEYDPNAFAPLPEDKPTVPSSGGPKEFVQLLTKQPTECVFGWLVFRQRRKGVWIIFNPMTCLGELIGR